MSVPQDPYEMVTYLHNLGGTATGPLPPDEYKRDR
jgi:hypothetical protein